MVDSDASASDDLNPGTTCAKLAASSDPCATVSVEAAMVDSADVEAPGDEDDVEIASSVVVGSVVPDVVGSTLDPPAPSVGRCAPLSRAALFASS